MASIGFKVDDSVSSKLKEVYPSLNFGASRAVISWYYLRTRALSSIKDKITKKEEMLFSGLFNSFNPAHAGSKTYIKAVLNDSRNMGINQKKFSNKEWEDLMQKIEQLSPMELFFLVEDASIK